MLMKIGENIDFVMQNLDMTIDLTSCAAQYPKNHLSDIILSQKMSSEIHGGKKLQIWIMN